MYRAYMKSHKWRQRRELALERDNYTCQECGAKENLQVHHLRYTPNLFDHDPIENHQTLCETCHHAETTVIRFERYGRPGGLLHTQPRALLDSHESAKQFHASESVNVQPKAATDIHGGVRKFRI